MRKRRNPHKLGKDPREMFVCVGKHGRAPQKRQKNYLGGDQCALR